VAEVEVEAGLSLSVRCLEEVDLHLELLALALGELVLAAAAAELQRDRRVVLDLHVEVCSFLAHPLLELFVFGVGIGEHALQPLHLL